MLPPAPPSPPPAPPSPPPAPSPLPAPPLTCYEWCETWACDLKWIADEGPRRRPSWRDGGELATAATADAAIGGTTLGALLIAAAPCYPSSDAYYYYYYYEEGVDAPTASSPPAPPPNVGSTCYSSPWATISDCVCHSSCATCGYYDPPTSETDCITCRHGGPVLPVHDDGTGYCSDTSGEGQTELLTGCYKLCDRDGAGAAAATDRGGDCTDSCFTRGDGYCDDGGPSADYNFCALGTDCYDCGTRNAPPAPPKADVVPPPPPSPPSPPPEGDACASVCSRRVGGGVRRLRPPALWTRRALRPSGLPALRAAVAATVGAVAAAGAAAAAPPLIAADLAAGLAAGVVAAIVVVPLVIALIVVVVVVLCCCRRRAKQTAKVAAGYPEQQQATATY